MTLRRLVEHLKTEAVRVAVLCAAGPARERGEKPGYIAEVRSLPLPFQHEYRLPGGLSRDLKRELLAEPDTLIHLGAPDTLAASCLRFAGKHGIPVVSSFHSNIVSYFKYLGLPAFVERLGWRYFRWFYGRCDQVYVPTDSMRAELERHGVRANYLPWPRGVDRSRFTPARRSTAWRSGLGIGPDDVVVLFVARLKWEKNIRLLARVMERLHDESSRVRTVVVGDGVGRGYLARSLPKTRFTGHLAGDDLATAYASSEIFLYPSTTDTFGNVTLEAMASGLPAVCADAPGSRSLVRDGVTGFLADPGSVQAFCDRVLALARDDELRSRMSEAAVAASRDYDWEAVMRMICGYYDDLYAARHAPPSPEPGAAAPGDL